MATTMNLPSIKWLSELELEEYNMINSYQMNSFIGDHTLPQSFPSIDDHTTNYDDSSYDVIEEKPMKVLETLHISQTLPYPPPPPQRRQPPPTQILSFQNGCSNTINSSNYLNSIFSPKGETASYEQRKADIDHQPIMSGNWKGVKRAQVLNRSHSQAQEHIIAERKRREKLTQRFVALSAMVPGLKKMDKASVLGDAIKHIKYLQERVKEFEEEKKERSVESMVLLKKSQLILDEEPSPPVDGKSDGSNTVLPEIEVRVSCNDVMIKILCEKQKGHVTKILDKIENLHLSIINSNVLPFGSTLDITVIAKKELDFDMTLTDTVKKLRLALLEFM